MKSQATGWGQDPRRAFQRGLGPRLCGNTNQAGAERQLSFSKHASKGTAGGRLRNGLSRRPKRAHGGRQGPRGPALTGLRVAGGGRTAQPCSQETLPGCPDAPSGHTPTSSRHLRTTRAAGREAPSGQAAWCPHTAQAPGKSSGLAPRNTPALTGEAHVCTDAQWAALTAVRPVLHTLRVLNRADRHTERTEVCPKKRSRSSHDSKDRQKLQRAQLGKMKRDRHSRAVTFLAAGPGSPAPAFCGAPAGPSARAQSEDKGPAGSLSLACLQTTPGVHCQKTRDWPGKGVGSSTIRDGGQDMAKPREREPRPGPALSGGSLPSSPVS